jgi:hypothetical protein
MLTPKEMKERLRPKCELMMFKYRPIVCGSMEMYGCEDDRQKCESCGHMNKNYSGGCCGEKLVDECNCTTYYCRTCGLYQGTEMPEIMPTCKGYPVYKGREEEFNGYSNDKLLSDLGISSDKT